VAIRAETYALARPIPYLLQQQPATQDVEFPLRHGSSGALIEPTSGTAIVSRPNDEEFSSGAVAVASSVASYTVPDTSAEDVGAQWTIAVDLTIAAKSYKYRRGAYLCEYVPPCPISVLDLYGRVPELEGRIPHRQGPTGTGEGWQPQIDAAYYEFLRLLIADARPIWLLRSAEDYYDFVRLRACELAAKAIPAARDSSWDVERRILWSEAEGAKGRIRLEYTTDRGHRSAGEGPIRTVPAGRPLW